MVPQIPYAATGTGIAVISGVRAFLVAETVKERAIVAGVPILVFLVGSLAPSLAGRLIALIGWILYGIGCLIFLRLNGVGVR